MDSDKNIYIQLANRYPQLLFPISNETQNTEDYKNAVNKGIFEVKNLDFVPSERDELTTVNTPVGKAEILVVDDRDKFVRIVRALAHKCEEIRIPQSMGATTILGLINWEKIHNYKIQCENDCKQNGDFLYRLFISNKNNYIDKIIVLSTGYYSSVTPDEVKMESDEWRRLSITIRKYHELTHYVCRKLYPNNIDFIRDEVIADMIGIVSAFGRYNPDMAALFLGIENDAYRPGGRLENYVSGDATIEETAEYAKRLIYWLDNNIIFHNDDIFLLMQNIMDVIPTKDKL